MLRCREPHLEASFLALWAQQWRASDAALGAAFLAVTAMCELRFWPASQEVRLELPSRWPSVSAEGYIWSGCMPRCIFGWCEPLHWAGWIPLVLGGVSIDLRMCRGLSRRQ